MEGGGLVRRLLSSLFELLESRGRMAALELEEARIRWLLSGIILLAGLFSLALALICATVLAILLLDAGDRIVGVVAFTGFYLLVGVVALVWARFRASRTPPPLSETFSEIEKDRECLFNRRNGT